MKENRWLFFALGVSTVLSIGAVTNQVASEAPRGLGLSDRGIVFPDGTVQVSAATAGTSAIPCYCRSYVAKSAKQVVGCTRTDTGASFSQVPTGKLFLVSDVTLFDADLTGGSIYAILGLELDGTVSVADPYVDITTPGYPEQARVSFRAPYIVIPAGEKLALRNSGFSAGAVSAFVSGFLVSEVTQHL